MRSGGRIQLDRHAAVQHFDDTVGVGVLVLARVVTARPHLEHVAVAGRVCHLIASRDAEIGGRSVASVGRLLGAYHAVAPAVGVVKAALNGIGELRKVGRVEGEIGTRHTLVQLSQLVTGVVSCE